jgi:Na+-translocating ferredoxin:NAD+ oxidoreductase subunit B
MESLLTLLIAAITVTVVSAGWVFIASLWKRAFFAKVLQIRRALPGLDCGICGNSQCIDFAESVASGNGTITGCVPGGTKTAHAIADIMNTAMNLGEPLIASVHCKGGKKEAPDRCYYQGIQDCHAAMLLRNGAKGCPEGCLGLGTCVEVCPSGALSIESSGVAVVDRHKCTGCGTCIKECPRKLITLIPHVHKIFLACNNHDYGEKVLSYCAVGCTACEKCVENTPSGAIRMVENLPKIDYFTPNENFVTAVHSCPSSCFVDTIKARPKANIDTKCDGCGDCIPVCPVEGAITGVPGQRHIIKKELCIGCGRCLTICHARAISLWGSLGYEVHQKHQKRPDRRNS